MKNRYKMFGCLLALQLAGSAVAAQAQRPLVAPPPEWVLPPLAELVMPAATDAPVQVLLNDEQIRITTDAVETFVATRLKIQSPQGLDALGTIRFGWQPDSDVLTVHRLSLTRAGQPQDQDLLGQGEALTILRREDQLEQAILTGMLTALIQPAGLRVGDVIEMSYTLRRRDPVVHDSPDAVYVWGGGSMNNARLRVTWPEALPLRWRATAHMPAAEPVQDNGWMDLTYQLPETVPLLQPTGAPGRFAALRMLEVTTYRNWQALSQRLAPLYVEAAKLAANSPLRAEATRIRREHATPAERAAAALRLVQDEIRYVLLAMNDGGLNPAPADQTWERRFGDCKAKSAMLLALLHELGIEAEVAAVSSSFGDGLDARLPGVGVFDHVLVRAQIGGKTYWLDGTRTGDRSLARIHPPPFRWALPLTVRGSALVEIPLEPLPEPITVVSMQIDATEGITLPAPFKVEMKVSGDAAQVLKQNLEGVPAANREEGLRAFWRQQYRGLEVESTSTAFDETQGVVTWAASGTMRMEWDPQYNTYEPHDMSLGYRVDLTRPRGTDAAAPYAVAFPAWTRTIETIRLPAQREPFTVTGTDINTTVAGGEFRRTAKVENNVFTAERDYRSIAPEFAASQRAEAERVLLEMSRNNLFLKKPAGYLPTAKELLVEADQEFDDANHYYSLGRDMTQRNLLEQAGVAFDKALELDPQHDRARLERAHLRLRKADIPAAITELQAGLAAVPGNTAMLELLSAIHAQRAEWSQALPLFDALVEARPDHHALAGRSHTHNELGNHELALRDAVASIAADPKHRNGYVAQAKVLQKLGREDEIPAVAEAFRQVHGADPAGLHGAIALALAIRDKPLARKYLDEEIERAPSAIAYLERARQQDADPARLADLRTALRQPDANSPLQVEVAKALLEAGLHKDAVELLNAFEEEKVVLFFRLYGLRGIAHWKLGDQAAARRDFASAREGLTNEYSLNDLCWDKGTFDVALEAALQECDEQLASEPDCPHCLDSRALVLLRMGRLDESIQYYDRALALVPAQAASLYGRGLARIRQGDREAGEQDLVEARRSLPLVESQFARMGLTP